MILPRYGVDLRAQERFRGIFGRHFLEAKDPLELNGYYFAAGAYADMSRGNIGKVTVTVKVWRGVPWSVKSRTDLEIVSVLFLAALRY